MSAEVSISAKVPEELSRQLDQLAVALGRNRSWVIEEALKMYIAQELSFREDVEEGIRQMEAGDVVPHAEVVDYVRSRRMSEARASAE